MSYLFLLVCLHNDPSIWWETSSAFIPLSWCCEHFQIVFISKPIMQVGSWQVSNLLYVWAHTKDSPIHGLQYPPLASHVLSPLFFARKIIDQEELKAQNITAYDRVANHTSSQTMRRQALWALCIDCDWLIDWWKHRSNMKENEHNARPRRQGVPRYTQNEGWWLFCSDSRPWSTRWWLISTRNQGKGGLRWLLPREETSTSQRRVAWSGGRFQGVGCYGERVETNNGGLLQYKSKIRLNEGISCPTGGNSEGSVWAELFIDWL